MDSIDGFVGRVLLSSGTAACEALLNDIAILDMLLLTMLVGG